MEKELFVKAINALEQQLKYDVSVSEKLGEVFPNAFTANLLPDNHILNNIIVEILQNAMNDKSETSWIEHYIYALNFGKDIYHLKVYDKNKKEIPLSTAEQLYDALANNKFN